MCPPKECQKVCQQPPRDPTAIAKRSSQMWAHTKTRECSDKGGGRGDLGEGDLVGACAGHVALSAGSEAAIHELVILEELLPQGHLARVGRRKVLCCLSCHRLRHTNAGDHACPGGCSSRGGGLSHQLDDASHFASRWVAGRAWGTDGLLECLCMAQPSENHAAAVVWSLCRGGAVRSSRVPCCRM